LNHIKSILSILEQRYAEKSGILLLKFSNIEDALKGLSESKLLDLHTLFSLLPEPIESDTFGDWVKRSRERLGQNQTELAGALNVRRDRICKLEGGEASEDFKSAVKTHLIKNLREGGHL
jgi:DNA-binding XRE family transcriptional regulator